ncbi:MAG: RuvA C-terminal domain-containing protein [Myxococcota bacterium]
MPTTARNSTLGLKERECRTALDRCAATLAPTASREEVLRAALRLLSR